MTVHQIEDAATRRQFLALIAAAGLLTACSNDDDAAEPEATATPSTRTVEGAYGPIEIPTNPQRIFADLMTVDYLTALGYDTGKIVGCFEASFFKAANDHYLKDFFASPDLADPGSSYEMKVEVIAAARPDLILMPFDQIDGSPQMDQLKQIAPLLVVPTSSTREPGTRYGGTASFQNWRSTLLAYGRLLDLEDRAREYITETEGQLAALSAEYGELIASIGATEAKVGPDFMAINVLSAAGTRGVLGTILMSELGFKAPDTQADATVDEYGSVELSEELIDLVDGDILFLEVRENSTYHTDSPLWDDLDVVQNDAVFVVGNHWEFGGAVAARKVIEDIDRAMGEFAKINGASTASPEPTAD